MLRYLFFGMLVFAVCGLLFAQQPKAELSAKTKRILNDVRGELLLRISEKPLTLQELVNLLDYRYKRKEEDVLTALLRLESITLGRLRRLNPFYEEEEEEEEVEYVDVEFDVRDIVAVPPDYFPPSVGAGFFLIQRMDEGEPLCGIDPDALQELIWTIAPEGEIQYGAGKLWGLLPKDKVDDVETLFAEIRKVVLKEVHIDVKVLEVDASYYLSTLGDVTKQTAVLTEEQEKKLLVDGVKEGRVEVVAAGSVTARNGQNTTVNVSKQHTVLMDYDINTTGMPSLQPVVRRINVGLICGFKPLIIEGGKEVQLNILGSYSTLRQPIRKSSFEKGELFLPETDALIVETSVRVKNKGAVLVGGTLSKKGSGDDKKGEKRYLLYLKVVVSKPSK